MRYAKIWAMGFAALLLAGTAMARGPRMSAGGNVDANVDANAEPNVEQNVEANFDALAATTAALARPVLAPEGAPWLAPQDKDYLSEAEADKIRDADTPALRIKIYVEFAEDRLKKFDYELHRTVPERRRGEILNALLNGYSGCVDDAADQIDEAKEKQLDIRDAIKMMKAKDKEFLTILEKYEKDGTELDTYRDTLEDAIDGTKDALSDLDDAEKEATPGPVRRKPS